MTDAISGVTFICDVLRPDVRGAAGGVDGLANWLFNALKRQIAAACGRAVSLFTTATDRALAAWVGGLRPPAEADNFWAANYQTLGGVDTAMHSCLLAPLRETFCVGYELPPYFTELLDAYAIPFIDIRLHPIRFLDDLLFAVRASHEATQHALMQAAVAEAEVLMTAGLREAMCQLIGRATVPPNSLLVLGQRRFDATQIVDGVFYDAMDHQTQISTICASHPAVVLKPHPLDRDHSLLSAAVAVTRNVIGVVDDNVYRLLALPEITAVLSVSSSVAEEARYFGKTVHRLVPSPWRLAWRGDRVCADQHVAIDDGLLSIDFWRTVLSPHTRVTCADGARLAAKPNRLRLALDSFWDFNEIDSDRLPQPRRQR